MLPAVRAQLYFQQNCCECGATLSVAAAAGGLVFGLGNVLVAATNACIPAPMGL